MEKTLWRKHSFTKVYPMDVSSRTVDQELGKLYENMETLSYTLTVYFSRMRSKGSRFTGVWGLRVCSLDVAFTFATVRNRSQPSARLLYGRAYVKLYSRGSFLEVSNVSLLRFAWQAWQFVTFRRVL